LHQHWRGPAPGKRERDFSSRPDIDFLAVRAQEGKRLFQRVAGHLAPGLGEQIDELAPFRRARRVISVGLRQNRRQHVVETHLLHLRKPP
jgi:hypothetical protein